MALNLQLLVGALAVLILLVMAVKITRQYERAVVFRFGKLLGEKGPGLFVIIPFVDRIVRVDLRVRELDVPKQTVISSDNVSLDVDAVIYFKVTDSCKAIVEVEDYESATTLLAQTTLRSVCGQAELDELLSDRDKINNELQEILDTHTDPWGIKVATVELKHIDLPQEMQRAMAKQAEAERERRSKIINAEGEFQASRRLAEAAEIIEKHPVALQLRYLQTMREMASESNTNTIFTFPMDIVKPFFKMFEKKGSEEPKA